MRRADLSAHMVLGVAVDVGLRNMSVCALQLPPLGARPARVLDEAKTRLEHAVVEAWDTSALGVERTKSEGAFVAEAKAVAAYVAARKDLFARADFLVVEHQMAPKMRCVAGALIAAVAAHVPRLPIHFQMSSTKLAWDDLAVHAPDANLQSYAGRKKAAVRLAHWLVDLEYPPPRKRKRTDHAGGDTRDMGAILSQSKKQDDLADSLLHLLAFGTRPAPRPRARSEAPGCAEVGASPPQGPLGSRPEVCPTRARPAQRTARNARNSPADGTDLSAVKRCL